MRHTVELTTSKTPLSSVRQNMPNTKTSNESKKSKCSSVLTKHPTQVARRNARERNRVREVNRGFVTLRGHVPVTAKNKKLSKVETLRQAAKYIKYLQELLGHQTNDADLADFDIKPDTENSQFDTSSNCSSPQSQMSSVKHEYPEQPLSGFNYKATSTSADDLYNIDKSALLPPMTAQPNFYSTTYFQPTNVTTNNVNYNAPRTYSTSEYYNYTPYV